MHNFLFSKIWKVDEFFASPLTPISTVFIFELSLPKLSSSSCSRLSFSLITQNKEEKSYLQFSPSPCPLLLPLLSTIFMIFIFPLFLFPIFHKTKESLSLISLPPNPLSYSSEVSPNLVNIPTPPLIEFFFSSFIFNFAHIL